MLTAACAAFHCVVFSIAARASARFAFQFTPHRQSVFHSTDDTFQQVDGFAITIVHLKTARHQASFSNLASDDHNPFGRYFTVSRGEVGERDVNDAGYVIGGVGSFVRFTDIDQQRPFSDQFKGSGVSDF